LPTIPIEWTQREDARQGAEAHGRHEEHAEDQFGHRAKRGENDACDLIHDRMRGGVARGTDRKRKRKQAGEHRSGDRHRQGVE